MPRRGSRTQIAPNIFSDDTGFAVIVKIAGKPKELRFAPGSTLEQLELERDALKGKARDAEKPRKGSLAADVVDYLATISEKDKLQNQSILCRHWTRLYGRESRFALTKLKIKQQITAWQRDGYAISTCNKLLTALRNVFNAVNTDEQGNPAAKVKKMREPEPEARGIGYDLIARILSQMPDRGRPIKGQVRADVSLTKVRCAAIAYTGLPPKQIQKIQPTADLRTHTILVETPGGPKTVRVPVLRARPRRKGKGTKESWLQLAPQGIDALKQLIAADGLKRWSNSSVRQCWHRACVKVIEQQITAGETPLRHRVDVKKDRFTRQARAVIVPLVRPYDLRHSFLTAALLASPGNLLGVQQLGQHSDIRQTRRYVEAAVPEAASQAATAVGNFLPSVAVPKYEKAKELAPST